ncbi:MAG: hypothetical protein ACFFC7_22020, partial [Candidatus Hermodarchaeota archaeon]
MKKFSTLSALMLLIIAGSMFAQPTTALPSYLSMNVQFIKWQEEPHIIHILVFDDDGRPGQPAALVDVGQDVLLGFEFSGSSLEELQDAFIDNPLHDITLSVDGGPAFSVKDWYQDPFIAIPGAGPPWLWDHDNDGLGDGDSDGIDDWDGPTLFFRYRSAGLTAGTHTFVFSITDDGGGSWFSDTITVIASPKPDYFPCYLKSVNSQFLKFQEKSDVIHILVFDDDGRPGQP